MIMEMKCHRTRKEMALMHSISNGYWASTKSLIKVYIILQLIIDMRFFTVPHIQVLSMIMQIRAKNFFKDIVIRSQQLHAPKIKDG